ncbi:MAG: hypothetical protein AB1899_04580 [Pseudomonadota bacterium]
MGDFPFRSRADLADRFATGLSAMLAGHDGLGVHVLVLANALQDPALWHGLRPLLADRQRALGAALAADLRQGRRPRAPVDDLLVFLQLMAIGFEYLAPVEQRELAGEGPDAPVWELQFNPVRALRPARMSEARVEGVMGPFDPAGFHFNKPFLDKEVFWRGQLAGKPARLLYNKFPFAPLHGLLVPEPERCLPQCLTPELHGWAWEVAAAGARNIPGFTLAYNSYGAYASVNHLHFQSFVREPPLPAQTAVDYPLARQRFTAVEEAWFALDELHQAGGAYNLLYGADGLLLLPRVRQGVVALEPWSAGFAWSEVSGVFPLAGREDYQGLTHADVYAALGRLTT